MILPTNSHGLTFPIPLDYWPQWATWATVAPNGLVKFWQNKPNFNGTFWRNTGGVRVEWGYVPADKVNDFSKCIWKR